jgi:GPI mannosyltransferase 3
MSFQFKPIIVACIIYSVTAYFSTGYLHADEHYQIIEFAGLLDGTNQTSDLAWEYNARIRPAIQPVLAHVIFQSCDFLGISSPLDKALVLRLLMAALAIMAIFFFSKAFLQFIDPRYKKIFLVLSYFLWFLPMIMVRFSSENWSGIFFLLALSVAIKKETSSKSSLLIGLFLGLSFIGRFQIAFAIFGFILWLLIIQRKSAKQLLVMMSSFSLVAFAGFLLDSGFYGQFTSTFINTFLENVLVGEIKEFGASPWYNYFYLILKDSFFPIGIVILLSLFYLVYRKPKNILVWVILPFLIGHILFEHKELRFLFPLAPLIPAVIIMSFELFNAPFSKPILFKSLRGALMALLVINSIGLLVACFKPAGAGRIHVIEKVEELSQQGPVQVYFLNDQNPYKPWGLNTHFYKTHEITFQEIGTELSSLNNPQTNSVLLIRQCDLEKPEVEFFISKHSLHLFNEGIHPVIQPFLKVYGYKLKNMWLIYQSRQNE